ncbi:MAG TPA: hypothetical protein VN958_17050 [Chitinophagaceae bacterium]|nr:hypothetical protein [Chitinophagaceae bacterium]
MKKIIMAVMLIFLLATTLSSCVESRRSSTCPSHDPNYFRR